MRTDRTALVTLLVLSAAFAAFFVLPFAGLAKRAIEDGKTWELARSGTAQAALWLSVWTSTVTLVLTIVFGTPVAYLLSRARFPGKAIVDAAIDLPIVLPPTVAGVALLTAFGRRGLVGEPIEAWTGQTFAFTTMAVIMAQVLVAAPFYVRAARSGFDSVDRRAEAVAYTLGASKTRTFFRIVLPQVRPAIMAGTVLCWARAMGELGATLIFAGNLEGTTQTMPLAIISAFEGSSLGLAGAIALSVMLLAVALGVLVVFRLVSNRETWQA
ncbi:ABC transporter permease [Candidatus Amarobacter glycogenicus]|uniref:ABC transporter permease n=1 Tax=Candidatus Amarobacter glycogenicus TaxID=3140699 RepID=UPI002A0BA9BF|nr:molybdate ABC transporter permease subunit [Dehalococcoidia bacterium]